MDGLDYDSLDAAETIKDVDLSKTRWRLFSIRWFARREQKYWTISTTQKLVVEVPFASYTDHGDTKIEGVRVTGFGASFRIHHHGWRRKRHSWGLRWSWYLCWLRSWNKRSAKWEGATSRCMLFNNAHIYITSYILGMWFTELVQLGLNGSSNHHTYSQTWLGPLLGKFSQQITSRWPSWLRRETVMEFVILRSGVRLTPGRFCDAFKPKLVRHLTSNEEIVVWIWLKAFFLWSMCLFFSFVDRHLETLLNYGPLTTREIYIIFFLSDYFIKTNY